MRGEEAEASDLDILVEFDAPPTFFQFIASSTMLSPRYTFKVNNAAAFEPVMMKGEDAI